MEKIMSRAGWVVAAIVSLVALAAVAGIVHGGPLDPPAAPGSTAGVLRPGTPITSLPFTITQPGNYYLTGNLTMSGSGDGISINAPNVTLDLGGFVVDGASTGHDGITTFNGPFDEGITIRNGTASHWTGWGFDLQHAETTVEHVQATNNGNGITIFGKLSDCSADANAGTGIQASFSTVENCEASGSATGINLYASTLNGCNTSGNSTTGIVVQRSVVEGCHSEQDAKGMFVTDEGSEVHDCTVLFSSGNGILVGGFNANVHHNSVGSAKSNGVEVDGEGALVEDNSVSFSTGSGIYVGGASNRIRGNTSHANTAEGLDILGSYNTVDDNSALQNTDYGIFVALGVKNTIVKNSATGNRAGSDGANYLIASGQNPGPVGAANAETLPWSNTQ